MARLVLPLQLHSTSITPLRGRAQSRITSQGTFALSKAVEKLSGSFFFFFLRNGTFAQDQTMRVTCSESLFKNRHLWMCALW